MPNDMDARFSGVNLAALSEEVALRSLPVISGRWFHVNPNAIRNTYTNPYPGSDAHDGLTKKTPLVSIATAYAKCYSGRGDGIVEYSNGTTVTTTSSKLAAAITWAKHGITVIGVCAPTRFSQRARITNSAVNLATLISVTGNNNSFYNMEIINEGTTGTGCLSVTGDRNYFNNIHCMGGVGVTSASIADMDLSLGGDENTFVNCTFGSDTFDKEDLAGFVMEFPGGGLAARNRFIDCEFHQQRSAGTTAGAIKFGGAGDCICRHNMFTRCDFLVWRTVAQAAEATVVIGTVPNNGHLIFRDCYRHGYTDWAAVAATASVYTNAPVGHEAGGAAVAVNPS